MKGLLLAFITLTSMVGFAQVSIVHEGESTELQGQTYTILWDGVTEDVGKDFIVTNNTGATKNTKIRREWISTIAGFQDYLCWGANGGIGDCYPVSSNANWVSPGAVSLDHSDEGLLVLHFKPNNNSGTAVYRYTVEDDMGEDLGYFDVQFVSTLSLKESKPVATISAYPNPAASSLTVVAPGLDNFTIRMTDVLGKVIYEETTSGTKKIDVSDFKNGVYLVTVLEKGQAVQTRRVVVKH